MPELIVDTSIVDITNTFNVATLVLAEAYKTLTVYIFGYFRGSMHTFYQN